MPPLTPDQVLHFLYERLDSVQNSTAQTREAQLATTRAVRTLADGLSASERRQQTDDRELARLTAILITLAAKIDVVHAQRDISTMTAEQIAAAVEFNTLCKARQIVWGRSHPNQGWESTRPPSLAGLAEPRALPPLPQDIPPVRRRNDDPTGAFKRLPAAPTTLWARFGPHSGWIFAVVLAVVVVSLLFRK